MNKCKECNNEYKPPYKNKELKKLSVFCPKCVMKTNTDPAFRAKLLNTVSS